ncbi:MAG TPA: hypothetical protein VEK38_00925 [Candidatus Bathyarchaeia archaeon]|nr:hypothetical protein [Candidatus Bathyarchaeia archaeon]
MKTKITLFLFSTALITTHTQIYGMPGDTIDLIRHIRHETTNNQERALNILEKNSWLTHARNDTGASTIFEKSVHKNKQVIIKKICSFPITTPHHKYEACSKAVYEQPTAQSLLGAHYLIENCNAPLHIQTSSNILSGNTSIFSPFFIFSLAMTNIKNELFLNPCKKIFTAMLSRASVEKDLDLTQFTRIYENITPTLKSCPYKVLIERYNSFRSKNPVCDPALFFFFFKTLKQYNIFSDTPSIDIISSQLYKDFYEWKPTKQLCNNMRHADIQ